MTVKTSVAAIRQAQAELVYMHLTDFAMGTLPADAHDVLRRNVRRLGNDFPDLIQRAERLGLFDEVPK